MDYSLRIVKKYDPVPHFYIDSFLPEQILRGLYQSLPGPADLNQVDNNYRNFLTHSGADDLDRLKPEVREFFTLELETVFPREFAEFVVFDLFQTDLEQLHYRLFGEKKIDITLAPFLESGSLDFRQSGNILPMHLDWPNRLVSLVLYLDPAGDCREDWGTRLYHVEHDLIADPVGLMSKKVKDPFDEIDSSDYQIIPFIPNRLVGFMNTPYSYHGAEVTGQPGQARWCYIKGINMQMEQAAQLFGLPAELL